MLTPFAWLLGLFLPACGMTGARGVPAAAPDFAHLVRPSSPNTALAAPADFPSPPDIVTPVYALPPARLFAVVQQVATAQPGTYKLSEDKAALREGWVARSFVLNFPDIIWAQVRPAGKDSSELLLYSRSVSGYGDFGVNRRRVAAWLAAVAARTRNHEAVSSGPG